MACPSIITGDRFLLRVVEHIDCQAQLLGSYGYQSLGQPGSLASSVAGFMLTIFVALLGIRMMFGPGPGARDVVFDMAKIGIVLTLAFSWPAFRTVVHDVVLDGPAEIASAIISPTLSDPNERFTERLQNADKAMVRLAEIGTGRNIGATLEGSQTGAGFAGTALQDDTALGYGRLAYLSGTIASIGLLRLIAALLLALTPLAAGLLLFEQTRGIFSGWLRGLTLALLGSVGTSLVLALQLSILEPWLVDALQVRNAGYAIPSAPIELFAITLAFAVIQLGMIWILGKIAFTRGWQNIRDTGALFSQPALVRNANPAGAIMRGENTNRAQRIADTVETQIRREQSNDRLSGGQRAMMQSGQQSSSDTAQESGQVAQPPPSRPRLGNSYRRSGKRSSIAALNRNPA